MTYGGGSVIRPRADEVRQVVDLLESDEFDSPDAMAKELIKLCAGLLAERETYAVGEGGIAWGFWHDARSAQKAAEQIGGQVAKVYPSGPLERRLAAFEVDSRRGFCPRCNHPWLAHIDRAYREGNRKTGPMREPGCCAAGCTCDYRAERDAA